ncbi:MAG: DUF4349 domain-containing protein [Bacteroidetes bacterium]|nr:DUF4349 domain-containing protein [Bacteroidota bacterium]
MRILNSIIIASLVTCFVACSSKSENFSSSDKAYEGVGGGGMELDATTVDLTPPPAEKSVAEEQKNITEQKLIKNGDISFEVKNIKDTKTFLQKVISKHKGYISNEKIEDYRVNPTEILTVRVPNSNFDHIINDIGLQVGEFDSKRIDIEDVTAEFVDIEARLKNKKQLEGKYQELLAKANNMTDILKIEKEISLIREDIESTEGRLRYLSNQVGYSTLIITYYEKRATAGFHFGGKMADALSEGGMGFLWFLIGMTQLWPMWLIGGLIWYVIYKIVKRRKNQKLQQKTIQ